MAIFTAIGAAIFGAGTFLAGLTAAALQVAAGIALNLIAKSLSGGDQPAKPAGIQGTLRAGGDVPRSILVGYTATAGSLVYANTWGSDGDTPNAYFTQVICLADYPIQTLEQIWVDGELVTLGGSPHPDYGYPVVEYNKKDKDYLWVKFYDGTQTVADSLLTDKVSSEERPYGPTRVGRGCPYVVVTAKVQEKLFSGFPTFKFAVTGAKLYDITKDTTAGGSGSQRWSNLATWGGDGDVLPAVQAYNVLRGIKYAGTWLYGLQGVSSANLPNAEWNAAVTACRTTITGPDGAEPTYRSGGEILISTQIASTIEDFLSSCQGRLAEVGGTYKMRVGAPGASIYSFSDDVIISTDEQSFTPFFGLADTINGISATYPSPADGWNNKVAPQLLRSDLEALDGARRLMADVTLNFVPYDGQVQRLMKSALDEARRARRHTFVLPPEAFVLEPGDIIDWTSPRNGYATKLFRVDGVSDRGNLDVMVDITEVDPADYDWDQDTDYTVPTVGSVVRVRPAPQVMTGWSATASSMIDPNGSNWLPSVLIGWASDLSDVRSVRIQVREGWDAKRIIFDGEIQYDADVVTPSAIINASFLANKDYEARGIYLPFSGRETLWSNQDSDGVDGAWLGVTTSNVPPVPPGSISSSTLNKLIRDAVGFVVDATGSTVRSLEQRIEDGLDKLGSATTTNTMASDRDRKALSVAVGAVQAAIVQESSVRAAEDAALSQFVLDVAAQAASGLAEGLFTVRAEAAPAGVTVQLALLARVTTLDDYIDTGMVIQLYPVGVGYASRITLKADTIAFTDGDVHSAPFVFQNGVLTLNVANIGTVNAGLLQGPKTTINLTSGFFSFGVTT